VTCGAPTSRWLAATVVAAASVVACNPPVTPKSVLGRRGILTGDHGLWTAVATVTSGALPDSAVVTATSGDRLLRITFSADPDVDAALWAAERRELLRSVFSPRLPPYPEFLTRESGCPPEFHPRPVPIALGTAQLLYAGANQGYGVCSRDQVRYRAAVVYAACPGRDEVFAVELLAPPTTPDTDLVGIVSEIRCR